MRGWYLGVDAMVRIPAPPIEWPITKTGVPEDEERYDSKSEERSERTFAVVPASPFSAGLVTVLPQPR